MQLARGVFLSPEKSYRRKLVEIFTTLRIEQELTKQEILALYLNKMFLGQRALRHRCRGGGLLRQERRSVDAARDRGDRRHVPSAVA